MPQYGDENDAVAIEQVQKMFPDREVVGVQTKEVAFGGGNIHWHQPSAACGEEVKKSAVRAINVRAAFLWCLCSLLAGDAG